MYGLHAYSMFLLAPNQIQCYEMSAYVAGTFIILIGNCLNILAFINVEYRTVNQMMLCLHFSHQILMACNCFKCINKI